MWWIFISIVFALILYVSTRNLVEYGGKGKGFIPVKFPIWGLLLIIFSLLIPILNILVFIVCIVLIFIAVSMGTKYTYDGWHLIEGKRNWVYSVVEFLQKEI